MLLDRAIKKYRPKKSKANFGFTLLEVLIYLAMVSFLVVMLTYFANDIVGSKAKSASLAQIDNNYKIILQKMDLSIRNAVSITYPSAGQSGNYLILSMPGGGITSFNLIGGKLQIIENGQTYDLTNSQVVVDSLSFTNLTALDTEGNIRINLSISHYNPEGKSEYEAAANLETSVSLRKN